MKINWFSSKRKDAGASFYNSHLTLNAVAKIPFEHVEFVRIGIDESSNLILSPVDRDCYDNPLTDKSECYPISTHASYARISSTPLLRQIADAFGLTFSSAPAHAKAEYDEKEGVLLIRMSSLKGGN